MTADHLGDDDDGRQDVAVQNGYDEPLTALPMGARERQSPRLQPSPASRERAGRPGRGGGCRWVKGLSHACRSAPARRAAPPNSLAALRHRRAGAADRVGPVEIGDRIGERRRIDRPALAKTRPTRPARSGRSGRTSDARRASAGATRPANRTAAACRARPTARAGSPSPRAPRPAGTPRARPSCDAPLGVDVGGVLLGIGGAGQHDIGARRAAVAVMALIDHKGRAGIGSGRSRRRRADRAPRSRPSGSPRGCRRHRARRRPAESRDRARRPAPRRGAAR